MGPSTASFPDAEKFAFAPSGPLASTTMFPGDTSSDTGVPFPSEMSIVGAVVSTTLIVNEFEPVFPCESVAVHDTTVLPIGKVAPDE